LGEILERIATVQNGSLQRLDDDVDIVKAYLKTKRAPQAAIEALEGLTVEQHVSWKQALYREGLYLYCGVEGQVLCLIAGINSKNALGA
jgi:hypothetical protein